MSTLTARLYSWTTDKNSGVPITASRMDAEDNQFVTKLNQKVLIKSSAPDSPIAGMLWYDSTNKLLKQFRNSEWVAYGAFHFGTAAPTTVQEGDAWYDSTNNLLKVYNGSAWESVITSAGGTFTAFPVTPSAAPDADYEVANKKYVEDFTPATPTAEKGLRLNSDGKIPAVDGSLLTNLVSQANDVETTGVNFETETTILSVAKTITSGKTVFLCATGYFKPYNSAKGSFTIKLKQGTTVVQTVILFVPADTYGYGNFSVSGIVTGLSGSVTFSVTAEGAPLSPGGPSPCYGNLNVIEL